MRTVFIGVVSIGRECLKALLETGANVVGIYTADKREMVKKSHMHPDYFSEFEDLSKEYDIPLSKISDVSVPLDIESLKQLQPDLIFCIGWPQMIKKELLKIPKLGCVGIHPTLLPERRGGAPINWCLIDGLNKSGVTLLYFDEGTDSGDIISQKEFDITLEDNAKTILSKVTDIAVELIREACVLMTEGRAPRIPQNDSKATYTRRRHQEDGIIDWKQTSLSAYNWIRALSIPFPGAFTYWKGKRIILWESELLRGYKAQFDARPGEILDRLSGRGMVVATGDYCLLIKMVEVDGKQMRGDEFMQRFDVNTGIILEK